ncbi:hypothetical protein Q1695_004719 [Nippostrongylus brasiliensis]|nr:hypothetical protein Q1695_004719 [Nippostrongylus brasiliensis]
MSQGRISTFVNYEWLLGNDMATAFANICRACNWRPSTVDDDEVRRCIKEKPEATTRELATTLDCNKSTIHKRSNILGYHKVLARCIPHRLTDANKQSRVAVCQSLLRPRHKEFLGDLVIGD